MLATLDFKEVRLFQKKRFTTVIFKYFSSNGNWLSWRLELAIHSSYSEVNGKYINFADILGVMYKLCLYV